MEKTIILSTAYLPPMEYMRGCESSVVMLEGCENYVKQSYRNRCLIATGNGVQALTIPVLRTAHKIPIRDVRIDYAMPWQRQHWRSIDTAYSNTPYFLYFQDYLRPYYEKKYEFLFDFNIELMRVVCKLYGVDFQPMITEEYHSVYSSEEFDDFRQIIHPKLRCEPNYPFPADNYTQIFEDRFGFIPHLSIIDHLFNVGIN